MYLKFDDLSLEIETFNHSFWKQIDEHLPITIDLEKWGNEYYGPVPVNIPQVDSINFIPDGGLAYSHQGNYFCIFFGQRPAWPVDYIGKIKGDDWKKLLSGSYDTVTITRII